MRGVAEGNCRALKDAVAYPDLAAQEGLVGSTPAPPHHYGGVDMLKTIYESAWFLAICLFFDTVWSRNGYIYKRHNSLCEYMFDSYKLRFFVLFHATLFHVINYGGAIMKRVEDNVEIQSSLTGIVWLPYQEKYNRYYKLFRYRVIAPSPISAYYSPVAYRSDCDTAQVSPNFPQSPDIPTVDFH